MTRDSAYSAPALWARVRDDYLAGETSEVVCARHGVSRSQLFAQARAGGWRRSDLAAADGGAVEQAADDDAPAPPTAELATVALRRGAHAVARGRLHEAQGWVALAARLRALAKDECDLDGWRRFLPDAAPQGAPEPPDDVEDIAGAVGEIALQNAELSRRRAAGEDVTRERRALDARVGALEAASAEIARRPPRFAPEAAGARAWSPAPDGPAGLPPGAGVSGAAVAAAMGWEPPVGGAWEAAGGG